MIYLKKPNYKVNFSEPLDEMYGISDNYEDGKWTLLSEEQEAFMEANPTANNKEIIAMQLYKDTVPAVTIEDIRDEKLEELHDYDNSDEVNVFYINDAPLWIVPDSRTNFYRYLEAKIKMGADRNSEVTYLFDDVFFTLTINEAMTLLDMLEVYAGDAERVAMGHENNIRNLQTIEEIEAYDFRTGFPEPIYMTLD